MQQIIQNLPHVNVNDLDVAKFNSYEELLSIYFVSEYQNYLGFKEYILAKDRLIAKFKDGSKFIIGYIK